MRIRRDSTLVCALCLAGAEETFLLLLGATVCDGVRSEVKHCLAAGDRSIDSVLTALTVELRDIAR
jgi:hypothetical protein